MLSELSQRELDVLNLLVIGDSNEQISEKLFIAYSTVKAHVQAILQKLKVNNRTQAAIIAAYFFDIKPDTIIKSANRKKY